MLETCKRGGSVLACFNNQLEHKSSLDNEAKGNRSGLMQVYACKYMN